MSQPPEHPPHDQFLRLYAEHEGALHTFVRSMLPTREEASEVMQEVIVILWQKFSQVDDFRPWAFGVARIAALRHLERRSRDRHVFDSELVHQLADESAAMSERHSDQREALESCLQKLPATQRELVLTAYTKGTRIDDLATRRGQTPMSLYKLLHRIRQAPAGVREAHPCSGGNDMNHDWHDLIQRYIAGTLSDDEALALQNALKSDEDLRALYLDYMNLDVALGSHAESRDAVNEILASPMAGETSRPARWLSWRPLTAAAAGIVFGMLCTSVVFGFVGQRQVEKKTPLAVLQPSFEDAQMPLARGFPPAASLWTGDVSKVVPAENGVTPKDGHHMVRLETNVHGKSVLFPRLYQIIPLPPSGSALREIEVSASFTSADPDSSPHYTVRAYAVNEAPERLGPDWFARHWFIQRDESIASAETGFENPPGNAKWQSIGLRMQVPGKARCLVVFFGVKNQAKSQAQKPHYLDAVQVSFVESPSIP